MGLYEQIGEAVDFIGRRGGDSPEVGVVLGSGLGDFVGTLGDPHVIPYETIPFFKKVGISGHAGRLVTGKIRGIPVVLMQGRYHYYEGHSISDVVFPVRVLCGLGIRRLILTNVSGGISPLLEPGDLMIIRDHLNLMGVNPLRGPNDPRLGERFPDMSEVYDVGLIGIASAAMRGLGLKVKEGVYAALGGPSYETPAEIRMLRLLGADAVGMSTVPEALAARHRGVPVLGLSCIGNPAAGLSGRPLTHREVTETANRVKDRFAAIMNAIIANSVPPSPDV